jgi:hypothetical protein
MSLMLVVGALKEEVTDSFNDEALAVRAGRCFRTAYSEEVLIKGDMARTELRDD